MSGATYPQEQNPAPAEFSFFDYLGTLVEDESGWMDPLLLEQETQPEADADQSSRVATKAADEDRAQTQEVSQ